MSHATGRFAVNQQFQGRQLVGLCLFDTLMRAARSEIVVFALVVDAKDDQAEAFYRNHGFAVFGSMPRQLILSFCQLSFQ